MTLLVVLASVALIEILLKRAQPARYDAQQAWARKHLAAPTVAPPGPEASVGLSALSQALDRHGRGKIPERPQVSSTNVDKAALSQPAAELTNLKQP